MDRTRRESLVTRIDTLAKPLALRFAFLLALWLIGGGCSRNHYHTAADNEAYGLLREKSDDPRWALGQYSVYMDPRSRFREIYNEDRPPMPPDDAASHRFMHYVDGKHGYRHWHKYGDRPELENPWWREQMGEYAELTSDGRVKLSLDSALQIALINSPSYQQQLEALYLSALDVSTERFRFDVQFLQAFSGSDTTFSHLGRKRAPPFGSDTLSHNTDLRLRRQFATAGELLVGFANSTVWQFAGPDRHTTLSILNFSIVQPLLRAGGRVIALETLTIVERALLANLRAFQRYRQGFFTQVAIGDNGGITGPQRRGGFFGGTGLTGFTGTGAGGLGGVGEATGFGRGGFGGGGGAGGAGGTGVAAGGAGQVGGFIGLLQAVREIANRRESLNLQQGMLGYLNAQLEGGRIDRGQVDQFRQNILSDRALLIQSVNAFADTLDVYKTAVLGLPPDIEFVLDESFVRPFQFSDPELAAVQERISGVQGYQSKLGDLAEQPDPNKPALPPDLMALRTALAEGKALQDMVGKLLAVVKADLDQWQKLLSEPESAQPRMPGEERQDQRELWRAAAQNLGEAEKSFGKVQSDLKAIEAGLNPKTREESYVKLITWAQDLVEVVNNAQLVQVRARVRTVPPVQLVRVTPEEAIAIARANRLDWMNNRAALVDSWRLIEFNANALKSDVDIVFSGDLQTTDNKPFRFRGTAGSLQVGLQIDGPFNRLLERNSYRQALIDYQQDRRQLIQYEDGVYRAVRAQLRDLEQLQENLEIQRSAVDIAAGRVDQSRDVLKDPAVAPPPTAVNNLLGALSDLRNTQNNFMSVWLNYYATRMQLYRELGVMELDERGAWVDRPIEEYRILPGDACPLPPEVPVEWLRDAGLHPGGEGGETPAQPELRQPIMPGPQAVPSIPPGAPAGHEPLQVRAPGLVPIAR
jgi:outer membrane protein TolC